MLVLRRRDGQWIEVRHRSGDLLRFRVYEVGEPIPGRVNLAFDDDARNFQIERPERLIRRAEGEGPPLCRTAAEVEAAVAAGAKVVRVASFPIDRPIYLDRDGVSIIGEAETPCPPPAA